MREWKGHDYDEATKTARRWLNDHGLSWIHDNEVRILACMTVDAADRVRKETVTAAEPEEVPLLEHPAHFGGLGADSGVGSEGVEADS